MNGIVTEAAPTSTAATPQTEETVVAAISSGGGQAEKEQAIRERAYAIWKTRAVPTVKIPNIGCALSQKWLCQIHKRAAQMWLSAPRTVDREGLRLGGSSGGKARHPWRITV